MKNCSVCKLLFHKEELVQNSQNDFTCKDCIKCEESDATSEQKAGKPPPKCEGDGGSPPKCEGDGGSPPKCEGNGGSPPKCEGDGESPPKCEGDGGSPPKCEGNGGSPPKCEGDGGSPPKSEGDGGSLPKCERDVARKMFAPGLGATIEEPRELPSMWGSLQCPHRNCKRYVSVSGMGHHFQCEHNVPITQVRQDQRISINFVPTNVRYGRAECLIILKVTPKQEPNTSSDVGKTPIPITMAVLAAKLSWAHLKKDDYDNLPEHTRMEESISGKSDRLVFWVASHTPCDYIYTVAVSKPPLDDLRIKYYGPILQLGETCENVCLSGRCLILNNMTMMGMSRKGLEPLNLHVVVHSEE